MCRPSMCGGGRNCSAAGLGRHSDIVRWRAFGISAGRPTRIRCGPTYGSATYDPGSMCKTVAQPVHGKCILEFDRRIGEACSTQVFPHSLRLSRAETHIREEPIHSHG